MNKDLEPARDALDAAGIGTDWEQTGGGVYVLTVRGVEPPGYIWVTEPEDVDGLWAVGLYRDAEDEGQVSCHTLAHLPEMVRRLLGGESIAPSWERTNDDRANRARRAVLAYQGEEVNRIDAGEEAAEEVLADLEGDLRHLCDRLGVSIADAERRGYRCYLEELADEKADEQLAGRVPRTVQARELEPGWEVKAPGAPSWSRIRATGHVTPGKVEAFTEWGSLVYGLQDRVEALPPLGSDELVEAGGMSKGDGLGA